jgi:hypothetical protein
MSNVCERVALDQFSSYLTTNHRLSSHQSGNRKAHSTETLNILVSDTMLEAIDKKNVTALVLLDMSKAFDSVNHPILLHKLKCVGASSQAVGWFKSYLSCIQVEDNMYVLDSQYHPSFHCLMACHRAPSYQHYCFVFIQMTFQRSHYHAISTPTSTTQNFF